MTPLQSVVPAVLLLCGLPAVAAHRVGWVDLDGVIGPATVEYVARAVEKSAGTGDACLIVRLDTPGGLLDATKEIVQVFYGSRVPVVVYVAPPGANAASAGCFITLAADVAAMAPGTNIGAAHPVAIGESGTDRPEGQDDVMTTKLENHAASYIEAIAERRGRNAAWARTAVLESASITATRALELHVIDLIAADRDDLLYQLDGRSVRGQVLATAGAEVVEIRPLLRERVFQLLGRPEVMLVLMLIAIYGLIGELSNPGAILPGVAGAIALILALYLAAVLPVNATGLALMGLAVLLFIADAVAATHGVLTTGGIIAFFLGGLFLFDDAAPAFRLSLAMLIPATLLTAAFFSFIVGAGLRAQLLPVRAGRETLCGRTAETLTDIAADTGGRVRVEGEDWHAVSALPVPRGQPVRVLAVHGLSLTVEALETKDPP